MIKYLNLSKKNSYFPFGQKLELKAKIINKNKIYKNIYEGECNFVKSIEKLGI